MKRLISPINKARAALTARKFKTFSPSVVDVLRKPLTVYPVTSFFHFLLESGPKEPCIILVDWGKRKPQSAMGNGFSETGSG
jgi:hypothetical protein